MVNLTQGQDREQLIAVLQAALLKSKRSNHSESEAIVVSLKIDSNQRPESISEEVQLIISNAFTHGYKLISTEVITNNGTTTCLLLFFIKIK